MSGIERVHVVVPAHDEAALLGRQLAAVESAGRQVRAAYPHVAVHTTVVLDSCTDGSRAVVARFPGVGLLEMELGRVGAARRAGVVGARSAHPSPPGETWVACTDADSEVPGHWLTTQVGLALDGADLVLGTVWPDPAELAPVHLSHWWHRHRLREGHPYVHGANLGFRLSAYDAVGGFRDLAVGEDVDLAHRMKAAGLRWTATSRIPVLTSGRLGGRTPAGFASYLLALLTTPEGRSAHGGQAAT